MFFRLCWQSTTQQTEYSIQSGLFLDMVIGQRPIIVRQLSPSVNQSYAGNNGTFFVQQLLLEILDRGRRQTAIDGDGPASTDIQFDELLLEPSWKVVEVSFY